MKGPDEVKQTEAGDCCKIANTNIGLEVSLNVFQDTVEAAAVEDTYRQGYGLRAGDFRMVDRQRSDEFDS